MCRKRQLHRVSKVLGRAGKVRKLKAQGAKTLSVARRGFLPAVGYETACLGATPTLVEIMRTRTSAAQGGAAVGRDRVLRLWLEEADPAVELTARPIFKWASAVWTGAIPAERLEKAWRRAAVRSAGPGKAKNEWKAIKGPSFSNAGLTAQAGLELASL